MMHFATKAMLFHNIDGRCHIKKNCCTYLHGLVDTTASFHISSLGGTYTRMHAHTHTHTHTHTYYILF